MVIKEYELQEGVNKIQVNGSGNILAAGEHNSKSCVWVEEDSNETSVAEIAFLVVKTGEEVGDMGALNYLGNCVSNLNSVWHIYEML